MCAVVVQLIMSARLFIFGADGEEILSRPDGFQFRTNDVIAFVGGADVVSQRESGHLETLLTVALKQFSPHFRNLGWEGVTVFDHEPRDFGFPPLRTQLQKAGASIIFLQYGRTEAMNPTNTLKTFKASYEELLDTCLQLTARVIVVTPPPFENGGGLLPDLSLHNKDLSSYAIALRELAKAHRLATIDLFGQLNSVQMKLTENGLQFTPRGHATVARVWSRQLGLGNVAERAGETSENGEWSNAQFESVRQKILTKNRLWFHYSRPQNWAFLGGDRTTQPSSRDHRNPALRWFPEEIERFIPLIQESETRINQSVAAIAK